MSNFKKLNLILLTFILTLLLSINVESRKPKIAVLYFDDASIEHWWYWEWYPGKGIADMIITELVNSKVVDVVEREKLNEILEEHKLSYSGIVEPATASRIGKLLGINFLLTGKVTQFSVREQEIGVGSGLRLRIGPLRDAGLTKTTARVEIDARLIEVETAKIVAATVGKGEESKEGVRITTEDWANYEIGSAHFQETILGKATRKAIKEVVTKIIEKIGLPEGKIIKIEKEVIYINLGKDIVKIKEILDVFMKTEEIIDPETGEVLGVEEEKVGIIEVTEVKEKYSKAKIIEGKGKIKVGNVVRSRK